MQPVHDRLADLKNRKGGETVADQRAEDAPALQLGEQRQRHPHPPRADPRHRTMPLRIARRCVPSPTSWPLRRIPRMSRWYLAVPDVVEPVSVEEHDDELDPCPGRRLRRRGLRLLRGNAARSAVRVRHRYGTGSGYKGRGVI